jgi:hypothetical protein
MKTRITLKRLNQFAYSYDVTAIRVAPKTYAFSGFGANVAALIRTLGDAGYRVFKTDLGRIEIA